MPFNFHLIFEPWQPRTIANLIAAYEAALPQGGWPNCVLGNHDRSRIASRLGREQARVAAMLLLTLRGTPTIYQAEEIGMTDVPIPPERMQDPWERNVPGLGLGRDPMRTPMQWDATAYAGFSPTEPWLPLAADHATVNVAAQAGDSQSMLSLYRALLRLRRSEPTLSIGGYQLVSADESILAYERQLENKRLLLVLNMTCSRRVLQHLPSGRVLLSTLFDEADRRIQDTLELPPMKAASRLAIRSSLP